MRDDQHSSVDFNAELHARPSIYFKGLALVEHIALRSSSDFAPRTHSHREAKLPESDPSVQLRVEFHTEFATVTKVTQLRAPIERWPEPTLDGHSAAESLGLAEAEVACRLSILVEGPAPNDVVPFLERHGFGDTAALRIASDAAVVCSDFRVRSDGASRILLFNKDPNAYRLGRMVRRLCEIETYRAMSLLGLPKARCLAPRLQQLDAALAALAQRNLEATPREHLGLLQEISAVSARIISDAATLRHRFGATAAYAKIVEERIMELREAHLMGFQRFGIFVSRRFLPAVRTCEATARRLEQLSGTSVHLLDLLQTRIQMEIEYQNAIQIQAMADRAGTQIKIQEAVEGFSVIAISYYLVALVKTLLEALDHTGLHLDPRITLASIPVIVVAVALVMHRIKGSIG